MLEVIVMLCVIVIVFEMSVSLAVLPQQRAAPVQNIMKEIMASGGRTVGMRGIAAFSSELIQSEIYKMNAGKNRKIECHEEPPQKHDDLMPGIRKTGLLQSARFHIKMFHIKIM